MAFCDVQHKVSSAGGVAGGDLFPKERSTDLENNPLTDRSLDAASDHFYVSDGDIIRGEYRVQLPDGRIQIVKYTADWKNGFNADVSYQGQPTYPSGSGSSSFPSGQSPNAYIPPASNSRY
ncbi:hypothetical protein RUM43_008997 [Polyplax serrata]|uniref:Uncharacterized protein n=1 Tax=Polyplax serrata TaxID=468196 RepID=A0AAN8NUL7_POLSC